MDGEADDAARGEVRRDFVKPEQEHGDWILNIGMREGDGQGEGQVWVQPFRGGRP